MSKEILTPKFLTREVAQKAVDNVMPIIKSFSSLLNRIECHIVILAPSMKTLFASWPNYQIEPFTLYEHSLGVPSEWPHKFDDIARCKALQLWHGRNDGRTDCIPHLLFPGDTPYWGGVERDGIVVACSGFQPHFDRMFSGMVAEMCIGLAYNKWAEAKKNDFNQDFLP